MRVIGYISHPKLKITVFKTDTRLPVQFEAGSDQQTYRFRRGGALEDLEDVKLLVDEAMCTQVLELLRRQSQLEKAALRKVIQHKGSDDQNGFPDII